MPHSPDRHPSATPPATGRRHAHAQAAWLGAALALSCAAHGESLSDAWSMALAANPSFAAVHSEREAAESERDAAVRQRLPALDLSATYTELERAPLFQVNTPAGQLQAPIWNRNGYAMAGADLSLPVWTSGRISSSIAAATAGARGAGAQEARGSADLKLAVTEAYVAVFRARRALAVAESDAASLAAHAADVQAMYDKQTAARADLLGAQVAAANAEQRRLRTANAVSLAVAGYNRWVGQPLDRAPDLDEPKPSAAAVGRSREELLSAALDHRPELEALDAEHTGLVESARAERARSLPQVALHAGYNHIDNVILDRQNFASIGIGFQWRLFDSGQQQARTNALRSRARAAESRLEDLRSAVRLEVETAIYNRDEASARIRVAAGAVAQAEENVRVARELYANGLGTNNQVLDAESLRVMALTNRDDANFDLLLAQYRLQRAIGEL